MAQLLLLDKIQLSDLTNNPHCFLSLVVIDDAAAVHGASGISVRRIAASLSRVISNDKIDNSTYKFRQTNIII